MPLSLPPSPPRRAYVPFFYSFVSYLHFFNKRLLLRQRADVREGLPLTEDAERGSESAFGSARAATSISVRLKTKSNDVNVPSTLLVNW